MYGTETCPHCQKQKEMFGEYFENIEYVECSEEQQICRDSGIPGVPHWKIEGQDYKGTKKLKD